MEYYTFTHQPSRPMKKYQAKDLDGKTIRQFGNMEDAIFFAETKGLEVWSGGKCIFHN